MRYFLSLGTNLGNRKRNLALACSLLKENRIKIIRASSVYRTEPVDVSDQPWFDNQVVEVDTKADPLALLNLVKAIEKKLKRIPAFEKGPRTIDIDILLAGDRVVRTRRLVIPHPRMAKRNFVLVPLREIAPQAVHPLLHKKIIDLARVCADPAVVRKLGSIRTGGKNQGPAHKKSPDSRLRAG